MVSYQNGEFQAFAELYRALAPRLRGYLASLTWSPEQAEDLLQETFLQIHRARQSYSPDFPVGPWVFAIARHCFLMECRAFSRKRKLEVFSEEELNIPVPAEMEKLADRLAVRRALARVADDKREALMLHHVWGFSYREIAGMVGIGASAAKVRAHRGMLELKQFLEEQEASGDG